MNSFTEPTPPKPQIKGIEQRLVIRAALDELHPSVYEVRPNPNDDFTLAQHFELAIMDSLQDSYAYDAIPKLLHSMTEAAMAKVVELSTSRIDPFNQS